MAPRFRQSVVAEACRGSLCAGKSRQRWDCYLGQLQQIQRVSLPRQVGHRKSALQMWPKLGCKRRVLRINCPRRKRGKRKRQRKRRKGGGKSKGKGKGQGQNADAKGGGGKGAAAATHQEDQASSSVPSEAGGKPSLAVALEVLRESAEKYGVDVQNLEAIAEKDAEAEASSKASETEGQTAKQVLSIQRRAWYKASDCHLKAGNRVQQCKKVREELAQNNCEAEVLEAKARKDFDEAAKQVEEAMAKLQVAQKEASEERRRELDQKAGAKDKEDARSEPPAGSTWETVGKKGKGEKNDAGAD